MSGNIMLASACIEKIRNGGRENLSGKSASLSMIIFVHYFFQFASRASASSPQTKERVEIRFQRFQRRMGSSTDVELVSYKTPAFPVLRGHIYTDIPTSNGPVAFHS